MWILTAAPVNMETWPRLNTPRVDARRSDTAKLSLPLDVKPPAGPARKIVRTRRPCYGRCTSATLTTDHGRVSRNLVRLNPVPISRLGVT